VGEHSDHASPHPGRIGVKRSSGQGSPRGTNLTLVVVAMTIGNALILVSQTAIPLALPSVMQELGVGSSTAQWVLTAGLLPLAGLMVLGGRLADLFGLRRIFVLGTLIFALASLGAGLAPSFEFLVVARAVQGVGGALLLPTSVAIVSSVAGPAQAGRALGMLGGAAAVAGACGPIIGGALTSAFGWRAVMLINLPLAAIALVVSLIVVPRDSRPAERPKVDILGASLLCIALVGIVFGLTQSQVWGWGSPGVFLPLAAAVVAAVAFVVVERRLSNPLMDFALLRQHRDYAGATISQGLGGMLEMGLGIIFPLILILSIGLDPAAAGLALLPTTLPMVIVAPLAGRWYDRSGGRTPLVVGFALLALAAIALMFGVWVGGLVPLIPGLLLYGIGLAIVLTVNDPVSLDSVPAKYHGEVSGVSATAEQFGGALGITLLFVVLQTSYVARLHTLVDESSLADLTNAQYGQLHEAMDKAEQTGLNAQTFDPTFQPYLESAYDAGTFGYMITFAATAVIAVLGVVSSLLLVRKSRSSTPTDMSSPESVFAAAAGVGSGRR
jgi:EmrB/QacA subfamily drug resistance transporter